MCDSSTITLDGLHEFVMFEADEFALSLIESAIRYRRNDLGITKTVETAQEAGIKKGDTVRFNSTARPKYLEGLTATVAKVNQKSVILEMPVDPRYRKFSGSKKVRTPVSIVEKVLV